MLKLCVYLFMIMKFEELLYLFFQFDTLDHPSIKKLNLILQKGIVERYVLLQTTSKYDPSGRDTRRSPTGSTTTQYG